MLWAMCWETLDPVIHVDINLTFATYLNIVADLVHPFLRMVFLGGSAIFQQENAHYSHCSRMVEHDEKFKMLPWPPNSPELNPIEPLCICIYCF